jgi:hypothetical protein
MQMRRAPRHGQAARPRVTVVTPNWGNPDDERYFAARAVAGAIATAAEVTVLHLLSGDTSPGGGGAWEGRERRDGAFRLVRMTASAPRPVEEAVVLAALQAGGGPGRLPAIAGPHLHALAGGASDQIATQIGATEPDVLVIAGLSQAWPASILDSLPRRPLVVTLPLMGDDPRISLDGYRGLVDAADLVFAISDAERSGIAALEPGPGTRRVPEVVPLPLPMPVNLASASYRAAGLSNFDNYAVFLRGFPNGTVESPVVPDYTRIRAGGGGIGIADLTHKQWRVFDDAFDYVIPVGPSRVNLWRLISHAVALVDIRPGGVIGREAIESLLIGTPVLLPVTSPSRFVVDESGGGYVFAGEDVLIDGLVRLTSGAGRSDVARRGREWAERVHRDQGRFVAEVTGRLFGAAESSA